tara:strand:+ start:61 stop:285 length:225 start_codon:yes stop_codon:yes gene_type:complete
MSTVGELWKYELGKLVFDAVEKEKNISYKQGVQDTKGIVIDKLTSDGGGLDVLYKYLGMKVSDSEEIPNKKKDG